MFRIVFSLVAAITLLALPSLAQDTAPASTGAVIMQQVLLFVPLIFLFYFLVLRPQNQQRKQHAAMIDAVRRGDTVVTSGGLIGKVTKVAEQELTIELTDNVRVRILRRMVADVRGKGQPIAANDAKPS